VVLEQTGHFRIRNSESGTTLRAVAMLAERMNKMSLSRYEKAEP